MSENNLPFLNHSLHYRIHVHMGLKHIGSVLPDTVFVLEAIRELPAVNIRLEVGSLLCFALQKASFTAGMDTDMDEVLGVWKRGVELGNQLGDVPIRDGDGLRVPVDDDIWGITCVGRDRIWKPGDNLV